MRAGSFMHSCIFMYLVLMYCVFEFLNICMCLYICMGIQWDVLLWGAALLRVGRASMHPHIFTIWGPEGLSGPGQAMLMDHLAHIAFSFMATLHFS